VRLTDCGGQTLELLESLESLESGAEENIFALTGCGGALVLSLESLRGTVASSHITYGHVMDFSFAKFFILKSLPPGRACILSNHFEY